MKHTTLFPHAWTPEQIATLAWFDAADKATITEASGAVSQWNDKSGSARHLTQGSGSLQPTTGTRTIGGLNAIDFDGTEYMTTGNFFDPQSDFALFAVYLDDDWAAGSQGVMIQNQDGGGTGRSLLYRSADDDLSTFLGNTQSIFTSQPSVASIAGLTSDWTGPTAALGCYLDGTLHNAPTVSTEANSNSAIRVAALKDGTQIFNGLFGEIILTSDITAATRQLIEGYLAWKWGLVSSLPAAHPYKNHPPTMIDEAATANAQLWTPSEITTRAWFDANDAGTITESGGAVSQWDDKSGNNYDVSQATPANQPVTNSRTIGGLNAIDFNGTSHYLLRSTPGPWFRNIGQGLVVCVVSIDTLGGDKVWWEIEKGDGNVTRARQRVTSSNFTVSGRRLDSDGFVGKDFAAAATGEYVVSSIYDHTNNQVNHALNGELNSAQTPFQGAGNTSDTDSLRMAIGARPTGANWYDGLVGEVIVVEGDITDETRQLIEGYLAWKWGLEDNLPPSHPYKWAAPTAAV